MKQGSVGILLHLVHILFRITRSTYQRAHLAEPHNRRQRRLDLLDELRLDAAHLEALHRVAVVTLASRDKMEFNTMLRCRVQDDRDEVIMQNQNKGHFKGTVFQLHRYAKHMSIRHTRGALLISCEVQQRKEPSCYAARMPV